MAIDESMRKANASFEEFLEDLLGRKPRLTFDEIAEETRCRIAAASSPVLRDQLESFLRGIQIKIETHAVRKYNPMDAGVDFDTLGEPLMPREELIAGVRASLETAAPEDVEEIEMLLRVLERGSKAPSAS